MQFQILPEVIAGPGAAFGSITATTQAVEVGISGGVSNLILTGKPKSFLTGFGQGFATFGVGIAHIRGWPKR